MPYILQTNCQCSECEEPSILVSKDGTVEFHRREDATIYAKDLQRRNPENIIEVVFIKEKTIAERAFNLAIEEGRLSEDKDAPNYAGNYMYMGQGQGKALFKNIETRRYDI